MKKILSAVVLPLAAFIASSPIGAVPVSFEYQYKNWAWGYSNHGCFVDSNGFVYKYSVGSNEAMAYEGQVEATEFEEAQTLLRGIDNENFTRIESGARDMGTYTLSGYQYGAETLLQQSGDFVGTNSSPGTEELVKMVRSWCGDISGS